MAKKIILIDAGPGSGKTTTLLRTHNYLLTNSLDGFLPTQEQYIIMETVRQQIGLLTPDQAVFACMTNSGKDNITNKLNSQTRAFTFNGLGASLLIKLRRKFCKLDSRRGKLLLEAVIGEKLDDMEWSRRRPYYSMLTYLKHLKEELLVPTEENLFFIQGKYGIEAPPPEDIEEMTRVLQRMAVYDGYAEHIDQYWLAINEITHPFYKLGYVDECQDLSAAKLLLMMKSCESLLVCGDPWQAINGFAGADYRAFERLEKMATVKLDLKTCFRCPPNHVSHINTIRPARIVAHKTEEVPDDHVTISELSNYIKNTGANPSEILMIARLNSILFRVGLQLMKQGVSSHILKSRDSDRAIDTILTDYISQTKARSIRELIDCCRYDVESSQTMSFQAGCFLLEKAESIIELSDGCKSINDLIQRIQKLTQDSPGSIPLTTIHKAKGLEAKYVYILYPPVKLKPKNPDQMEQEINLEFVSESRSLHKRVYVHQF